MTAYPESCCGSGASRSNVQIRSAGSFGVKSMIAPVELRIVAPNLSSVTDPSMSLIGLKRVMKVRVIENIDGIGVVIERR